jgi:hypothetical protein
LPYEILNKPALKPGFIFYLNSFYDLDSERFHGEGLMRIPHSKMIWYANLLNLTEDQTEEFCIIIRALDNSHLEKINEKRSSEIKNVKKSK